MNVIISPNIKKQKDFIDINGNIINKDTKEIIQENKPDYIPEEKKEENKNVENTEKQNGLENIIEKKIQSKIEEIVNKKIDDIFSRM